MPKTYVVNQRRNFFDLSHEHHTTMRQAVAYPVLCLKYKPGDSLRIIVEQLTRMLPLQTPTMSNIRLRLDFFRVDHGIVWPEFYDFVKQNGSEENPIIYPHLEIPVGGYDKSELMDYLGVEPMTGDGTSINALPVRSYHKILNDYYINSNIQEEVEISTDSGLDTVTPVTLRKVNWSRDRFTNAEISRQKGGDVVLPIGSTAPISVTGTGSGEGVAIIPTLSRGLPSSGSSQRAILNRDNVSVLSSTDHVDGEVGSTSWSSVFNNTVADLSDATGVSLSALSIAKTLQELRVVDLFAGEHYPDWQFANYGVRSSDARLQRSEWLGGFKFNIVTSEVLQTSQSTDSSPQGTMAGHGFSYGKQGIYVPYLDNFGYIMVIASIMPKAEYSQGLPDYFCQSEPFDWARPILSHMPLQEIKNKEIYLSKQSDVDENGEPLNDGRFAYEPMYDNYRRISNRISGEFRSTLSFWLAGIRKFSEVPKFNEDFIQANPSTDIFAVTDSDPFLVNFSFNIKSLQKLPKFGVPRF